jgi:uncharacterized phage protein (TIGR01671 family)
MSERVIKFRIWDKILKRFLFDHRGTGTFFSRHKNLEHGDLSVSEFIDDANSIVQQFTGLSDKNGREIYEGDILERIYSVLDYKTPDGKELYKDEKSHYIVKFGEFYYIWGYDNASTVVGLYLESVKYQSRRFFVKDAILDHYEPYLVVGNIYETPELLK